MKQPKTSLITKTLTLIWELLQGFILQAINQNLMV